MKTAIGLWIDQQAAFIVLLTGQTEATQRIVAEPAPPSPLPDAPAADMGKPMRNVPLPSHLSHYYTAIVAQLQQADAILIFGPDEAKGELKHWLERAGLGERVVGVDKVRKMTESQIVAKVRHYFQPIEM